MALDVSASVTGSVLGQLRRSVQQLAADLHAEDRLKLQTFNQRIQRLGDFASPTINNRRGGCSNLRGRRGSAVFDSLAVALAMPTTAARRHLVVLFSDGVDSSSISDPEMLFELARGSAIYGRGGSGLARIRRLQRQYFHVGFPGQSPSNVSPIGSPGTRVARSCPSRPVTISPQRSGGCWTTSVRATCSTSRRKASSEPAPTRSCASEAQQRPGARAQRICVALDAEFARVGVNSTLELSAISSRLLAHAES